jgi:hypothetical protein
MLTDTSVGDCGINRVVSLVDNAHLFALFCAVGSCRSLTASGNSDDLFFTLF